MHFSRQYPPAVYSIVEQLKQWRWDTKFTVLLSSDFGKLEIMFFCYALLVTCNDVLKQTLGVIKTNPRTGYLFLGQLWYISNSLLPFSHTPIRFPQLEDPLGEGGELVEMRRSTVTLPGTPRHPDMTKARQELVERLINISSDLILERSQDMVIDAIRNSSRFQNALQAFQVTHSLMTV